MIDAPFQTDAIIPGSEAGRLGDAVTDRRSRIIQCAAAGTCGEDQEEVAEARLVEPSGKIARRRGTPKQGSRRGDVPCPGEQLFDRQSPRVLPIVPSKLTAAVGMETIA